MQATPIDPNSVEGRAEANADSDLGPGVVAGAVAALNAPRAGGQGTLANAQAGAGKTYATLRQTHDDYDADYWQELRALYEGGKTLLRNDKLMSRLFPPHRAEHDGLYTERKRRALYIPYPAEIIDHLVAGVTSDPISMAIGGDQEKPEPLPEFYAEFVEDVSPDGGSRVSLNEHLSDQLRMALQTLCAWTLVDLPPPGQYPSLADQENAGALRAYAVAIDPESVIDWEVDANGQFLWVMIHVVERRRATIDASRSQIVERWTYYTRDEWVRYERARDINKPFDDKDVIPEADRGAHSFGQVPLLRLALPEGLWAMNKMASVAREHFNKRSALAWGEFQSLLPELYEFLGPEGGAKGVRIGENQEDPSRGTNQRRGQGFVQQRGHEDRAEFVGPDVAPFNEARQSCDALRDDMHRVMHQMALSAANNSAALKRSAESKQQDTAAVEIVLRELGRLGRKFAEAILNMVSLGRREETIANEWVAKGMAEFDSVTVSDSLKDALDIDMLRIESATFRKRHRMQIARAVLEGKVSPEDLDEIEKELDENITDESVAPGVGMLDPQAAIDGIAQNGAPDQPKMPKGSTQTQPGAGLKPGGGKRGRPGAQP